MVLSNKEWLDKMNEIISAIQNGGCDSQVIEDMLSNMWISSATYNVGDYVLYNNNIWKCLVQNSNIAPSEGTTWTRVNITSEISTLNSNLEETNTKFNNLHIQVFTANSNGNNYVTFINIPILYRKSAIFIGNGNGTIDFRNCALFSDGSCDNNEISVGTITVTDNGNGTANITINCAQWGIYYLIYFN